MKPSSMKLAAVLAVVSLPAAAVAQTPAKCLTGDEAEGLMTFALPGAVTALSKKCTPHLPATAALVQSAPVIAGKYQIEADKAAPVAKQAFDKISGMPLAVNMNDAVFKGLIDVAMGAGLTERLKPGDCGQVNRFVDILQPLPARNMAQLFVVLMEVGAAGRNGAGEAEAPFKLCGAQP